MVNSVEPSGIFQPLEGDDPRAIAGYRLTARLGSGGMGKVYLSYTPGGRPVAIKVIRPEFSEDPEFRRRFTQEAHAAQRVQGLFTAPVIDSDTDGATPWLATAYVPGPSLAEAVAAHGQLPVSTVLLLVAGVAEALQVIHRAGIVHRDLKPSNVLLAADGPRVIDFGIARAADAPSLTGSGVTVGTPAFMAPEQAAGTSITPAADVFALGQVAAYAATGTPAFGKGTAHGVLYRIVHEEPDLSRIPHEIRELVGRCLTKDVAGRPSVAEVIALCAAASGQTQLRRPEHWLPTAVAADLATRAAAPAPEAPAAGVATHPAQPPAPPAAPVPTALDHPRTPQPGFGAAASAPSAGASAPRPPKKKRRAPAVALVLAGALAVAAAGGGAVYVVMKSDGRTKTGQAADHKPKTVTGTPAPTDSPSGGDTGSDTPQSPQEDPQPVDTEGIDLPHGYYLSFADDPVTPKNTHAEEADAALDGNDNSDGGIHAPDEKLVLLRPGQQGTLDTCRSETRFTSRVDIGLLTEGSQMCLTTSSGTIALITFQGRSADSDPSSYVTLDVRVWRDAVAPQQGS
ncbi:serine/threonine-protein kinase [Streptomyces sp. GS7]|uniref:serine/threonine-protein kinase n=1 Tax=Streptomyces sp. GS7 TaxID=2692234 RepID=UPI0013162861|nr:serine/threonine-protein kinase [Streptomyces sp. GS7]QHC24760.1 protein kinase [Streptomyces sp. GS7]